MEQHVKDRFIEALGRSDSVGAACATAGVSRRTIYHQRKTDPQFAAAWKSALAGRELEDEGEGQDGASFDFFTGSENLTDEERAKRWEAFGVKRPAPSTSAPFLAKVHELTESLKAVEQTFATRKAALAGQIEEAKRAKAQLSDKLRQALMDGKAEEADELDRRIVALDGDLAALGRKLAAFNFTAEEIKAKFLGEEGRHKELAREIEQASFAAMETLRTEIAVQVARLAELRAEYTAGLERINTLEAEADSVVRRWDYARGFLRREERLHYHPFNPTLLREVEFTTAGYRPGDISRFSGGNMGGAIEPGAAGPKEE